MKLTKELGDKAEWVVVGPMGPALPDFLSLLPVLAVDGGAHWTNFMNVWVGDSDSYKKIPESSLVFHLPEDKDASDFSCALKLFDRQKSYHIHLWGFSGGRKDHELFVWGEILAWLEMHPECKFSLYDQSGRIEFHFMGSGHWRFEHKGVFSLGSIRKIRVKLTGEVRYPIAAESWLPSLSSLGLSNEGMGEVILENEGTVFIHYPVEEK